MDAEMEAMKIQMAEMTKLVNGLQQTGLRGRGRGRGRGGPANIRGGLAAGRGCGANRPSAENSCCGKELFVHHSTY